MSEKVRVQQIFIREYDVEGRRKMKFYLRQLENESLRGLLKKSNSMNSEGGLAKEINPSDV